VVVITKKLHGSPGGKISISGGKPVKCAFGAGGGKLKIYYLLPALMLIFTLQ